MYNPDINFPEFGEIKNEAGLNPAHAGNTPTDLYAKSALCALFLIHLD